SFRGFDYYVYPLKNKNCYASLFSKEVKYHVLSNAMKEGLIRQGILKENIVKITPAIDIDLFEKTATPNNKTIQLTTISRLHSIKGLDYILEALSKLKNEGIKFEYTIIGDGIEKERLLFAAYQLGIKENVNFVGKLPQTEVKQQLETTDIYLQYSIQEGFCNAVIEAQAMGLLCIVSDAEGLAENVLDGQTGWVVSKRQPKLLAEQLLEIMKLSEKEKEVIRIRAVSRVQKEFDLIKQQQAFIAFYTL